MPTVARTAKPLTREARVRRWRQYLAAERAEAAVYRELAERKKGQEREILLGLAEAEGRHEAHWLELLGDDVGKPHRGDIRSRFLAFLARHFGSLFVLALAQRAEARSPYDDDADASSSMAADERIHGEVLRGLAWPWCSASGRPAFRQPQCFLPGSPACWPGPCRWERGSTCLCARSGNYWRLPDPIRRPRMPLPTST